MPTYFAASCAMLTSDNDLDLVDHLLPIISQVVTNGGLKPSYLLPGGAPLVLRGPFNGVKKIRIELLHEECLHLKSVVVINFAGRNVTNDASVGQSSSWVDVDVPDKPERLVSGAITDAPYTVHTQREANPWIDLDFQSAQDLTLIEIYNRTDEYAWRASSLAVSVGSRERSMVRIFEQYGLDRHLESLFETAVLCSGLQESDKRSLKLAVSILIAWQAQDHDAIRRRVERFIVENGSKSADRILSYLNKTMLYEQELEINSHGIVRPFKFWSGEEKSDYLLFGLKVIAALQHNGIAACFGYGTALGLVRDRDLLPHDDDIDIIAAFPCGQYGSFSSMLARVADILCKHELTTSGDFVSHWHVSDGFFRLDVFVGPIEKNYVSFLPGPRREIAFDAVFPSIPVPLFGLHLPIPSSPFVYLNAVYGEYWYRSDPNWRHTWSTEDFADIV